MSAPVQSAVHDAVRAVELAAPLDTIVKPLGKAIRGAIPGGTVKDALSGTWMGHALHPLLTDLVIGTWTSAMLLDLLGGEDEAAGAEKLIAAGVAFYGPTALTGASDWADTELGDKGAGRVGLVHAASNAIALSLQLASLRARRRGDRGKGVALSLAAAGALGVGGHLGGHMSYVLGVGVDQTTFDAGDEDWAATDLAAADVVEGTPVTTLAKDTPVLIVRDGGQLHAIHDRCSHRGCSLATGSVDGGEVVCPCHGSRFKLEDGSVQQGPATAPQPAFDVREQGGRLEVRRRT